ncbi:MAG: T9SS type A sorting domain-containing protein [candidate division Zixibacteria bacterium]|nr:T9SS type A sorting domain-containing protein [candidate division Zixibacteria bacterium]
MVRNAKIIALSLLLTLSISGLPTTRAAAQDVLWSASVGGFYTERGYAGCVCSDGGYAILGSTFSYGAGDHDIYFIKLDSLGDTAWTATYGGPATDYGYGVQHMPDGGFVIVGSTRSSGAGEVDVLVIRTDMTGVESWSRTYGGAQVDEGKAVRVTSDGGLIIVGTTSSSGAGYSDLYLIRTNSLGDTAWTRTYGGAGGESGIDVCQTLDGGFVAVGNTGTFGEGYSSIYAVRTNASGDSLWATTYGGPRSDVGYAVSLAPDGGLVFAGATALADGYSDMYLVKTDPNGIQEWDQTYGGSRDDVAWSVQPATDGGYLIAGTTQSYGSGGIDMYVVKTNPIGASDWSQTYGGTKSDYCRRVIVSGNDYCLIGDSYSYALGASDVYVVKIEGSGATPVDEFDDLLPSHLALSQNYPNPFNMSTAIEFELDRRMPVTLTIFNVLGQIVRQWDFGSSALGSYRVDWDGRDDRGSEVASGIYLYRLTTPVTHRTKKMVLLK